MGLKDIIREAGEAMVKYVFDVFQTALGGIIEGLLQFLTGVITRTPYPQICPDVEAVDVASDCSTNAVNTAPMVFGAPHEGTLWAALYGIYTSSAQPYAYVLWMFALVSIQFTGIFDGLIPGINHEESKKKLMVAFLGITLWWPAGVMILGFSDALGTLLLSLGVPGGTETSDSLGLAMTYDVVMANLENNMNVYGLYITTILWFIEFLILMVLALLWFIRIAAIFIMMPLMPIFIAMWALELPGLGPLQSMAGQSMKAFTTLAFITIPGALIVGFFGTIIEVAMQYTEELVPGADLTTGGATDGQSYNGLSEPTGAVETSPSATADPVGSFSGALQPDPATTSAAIEGSAQAQSASGLAGGMVASLVFAVVIMSLPIVAGLAPVLMAKSIPGAKDAMGAASFLGGPAGAVAGAAVSAAGAADTASNLKGAFSEGLKGNSVLEADADEEGGGIMGYSVNTGDSSGSNYADKVRGAMTKEGVAGGAGAALFGTSRAAEKGSAAIKDGASTARNKAQARAGQARNAAAGAAPTREQAWGAFSTGADVYNNKGTMAGIAAHNAKTRADKAVGAHVENAVGAASSAKESVKAAPGAAKDGVVNAPGAAAGAVGAKKDQAIDGMTARANSASKKIHEVKTKAELEASVSGAKDEHMIRSQYEAVPDERHLTDEQQQMAEDFGYVDDVQNISKGMDSRPASEGAMPSWYEDTTADQIDDDRLEDHFGVEIDALEELADGSNYDNQRAQDLADQMGVDASLLHDSVNDGDLDEFRQVVADEINERVQDQFQAKLDDADFLREIAADRAGTDALYAEDFEMSVLQGMDGFSEGDWNEPTSSQDRSTGEDGFDDAHKASGSSSTPSEKVDEELEVERMVAQIKAGETVKR